MIRSSKTLALCVLSSSQCSDQGEKCLLVEQEMTELLTSSLPMSSLMGGSPSPEVSTLALTSIPPIVLKVIFQKF